MASKRCTKCGVEKPFNEFSGQSQNPDKLHRWCRGCLRAYAAGYYRRLRERHRLASAPVVHCVSCGLGKPPEDFYRRVMSKTGLDRKCKACRDNHNATGRNPSNKIASAYRRKYRISLGDYEDLLRAQGGCCAICGSDTPGSRSKKRFSVDHDHETGRVRGLLCDKCNRGLGLFGDSVKNVERAASYLRGSEQ